VNGSTALDAIHAEVRACTLCTLCQGRKQAVPGDGPANAKVMFIGEAPGWWENERGLPFVGPAGHLLDELLQGIGLERSSVYITNVIKCRPPDNRDPLPDEVDACRPYLDQQIEVIRPKVVVTLGRHSTAWFFPAGRSMRDLHGKPIRSRGAICMATYHPAAVLRQASLRAVIEQDFRMIPDLVAQAESAPVEEVAELDQAEQLTLF